MKRQIKRRLKHRMAVMMRFRRIRGGGCNIAKDKHNPGVASKASKKRLAGLRRIQIGLSHRLRRITSLGMTSAAWFIPQNSRELTCSALPAVLT